jgi:hypothetical protein
MPEAAPRKAFFWGRREDKGSENRHRSNFAFHIGAEELILRSNFVISIYPLFLRHIKYQSMT